LTNGRVGGKIKVKTVNWLVEVIKTLISSRYTGTVTLHFYKGSIGKVTKTVMVD
jgi:hypothetical protein